MVVLVAFLGNLVFHYLARSAKLPTGLYILPSVISFFFIFSFLTISRITIISGSAGLIFAIFTQNESVIGADLSYDLVHDDDNDFVQ